MTAGWEPSFTFHGFRYAEVTGCKAELDMFTAIVVSSDLRKTGNFTCSHAAINQLHSNVEWGMRGNFVSVPTDCPRCDERLSWTGDIQVFGQTANYLKDCAGSLSDWMEEVSGETLKYDGVVPMVIPYPFGDRAKPSAHAIWGDCVILTPWEFYQAYGDLEVLSKNWPSMCAWVDRGIARGPDRMWDPTAKLYGDWLDPKAPPQYPAHGWTDALLCANAYLVHVTKVIARIAQLLSHDTEARLCATESEDLLQKFKREYVSPNGSLVSDTQTGLALALHFDLLDPDQAAYAADRSNTITRWNYIKITTGFAGTPILLPMLAERGKLNLAYRMREKRTIPVGCFPCGWAQRQS